MIRTKQNFKPFRSVSSGAGLSLNEDITDGLSLVTANSDKITIDTLEKMNPLNQDTPFDADVIPPEILE